MDLSARVIIAAAVIVPLAPMGAPRKFSIAPPIETSFNGAGERSIPPYFHPVLWLISFAACSLAGVPLLFHEGFSLGKLREMAKQEKEELESESA